MRFKDNKAIYLQIADLICDDILQGRLLEDERIPSVREYAAAVEVNANTCVRAYDWLQGKTSSTPVAASATLSTQEPKTPSNR